MRAAFARNLAALPALFRIGVAETVAYRGEFVVWMLTSTMPLVNLALWTSVANEAAFQKYQSADFVAYFLGVLIVRNMTGNWVAWQMSEEIRMGILSMRMLRPIHPFIAYACTHAAALPFRSLVSLPVAFGLLVSSGASALTTDSVQLALLPVSIVLAWLVTFGMMFALGCVGFWLTQTYGLMNFYFGVWSLFSGYLMPMDILRTRFPAIADVAEWLPFYYTLAPPVELMTKHLPGDVMLRLVGGQAVWAAICVWLGVYAWQAGVRRFEAVGA